MKNFYSILEYIKENKLKSLALCLFLAGILNFYFFTKYQVSEPFIEKISLQSDVRVQDILIYASAENNDEIDFSKPIKPAIENDKLVFTLGEKTRLFRIYIGNDYEKVSVGNVELFHSDHTENLSIKDFKLNEIFALGKIKPSNIDFSCHVNSHFELKRQLITRQECLVSEVLIFVFSLLFSFLVIAAFHKLFDFKINKTNYKLALACVFFISIFLPQPIFNVAFMLSFFFIVRDFNYKIFFSNKTALLFLLYFLVFMANNVFLSQSFNKPFTETMLPFFFLPFYFACLPHKNYLPAFVFGAFTVSLYFFFTSAIDTSLYHDLSYFSFDNFSKYVHPVYFSYLLFFCICYIELSNDFSFNKTLIQAVLLFALIFCASKLIISLTVLFYAFRFFRKKQILGWTVVALSIIAVLFFSPTRKRFQEVFSPENLSVLHENPVQRHDPRINGLTIRLIIWQETLSSFETAKDIFFGKGVDKNAAQLLENRLKNRGLERGHTKYDPHNQFIATCYKTGLAGLIVLLGICFITFYYAIKNRNTLLLCAAVLFICAMFTESVLQRVTGIYFFICILSLLSLSLKTPGYQIENSHTRNKRNSQ
ncbi:MAG: O-antigen ligase family protein [Bacteroidetes bacterium]|nr:O-antigen ligase family protein [Bacteroidota bacterium]